MKRAVHIYCVVHNNKPKHDVINFELKYNLQETVVYVQIIASHSERLN